MEITKQTLVSDILKEHGVPLPEFIEKVQQAVNTRQS